MTAALAELALDETSQRALDERGYVVFPGLIDEPWRAALAARFDELAAQEDGRGREIPGFTGENGATTVADLVNKGAVFDGVWQHALILAAVRQVLRRRFKLSSLNSREPHRGHGQQGLHADAGPRQAGTPYTVCNSLWILDGFDGENGGTRVVPRSHLLPGSPADGADPAARHPDEVVLRLPPGSVVVFNAHLWHGGTTNRSGARRRVIHGYFTAFDQPQQSDQRALLRPETAARLSPAARALLDA